MGPFIRPSRAKRAGLMELAYCRAAKTKPVFKETLSQKGALALAKRLEEFWHAQGFTSVRFWAEPIRERFIKVGSYEIYRVACNLVNGLPPRYAEEDAPHLPEVPPGEITETHLTPN
jgi:hypothetical protein